MCQFVIIYNFSFRSYTKPVAEASFCLVSLKYIVIGILVKDKGFGKFEDIGEAAYIPVRAAQKCTREDLNIIFTYHYEENSKGEKKAKTAGKLVDNHLSLEGMFTFVFYSKSRLNKLAKKVEYYFETQNDGHA